MRLLAVSRRAVFACATLGLLSLVGIQGCSDDDEDNPVNPGPTSTQLTGTYANANEGGQMSISISSGTLAPALRAGALATHTIAASGSLTAEGTTTPTPLTGNYSEETDSLYLTGGGYDMAGHYDGTTSTITGGYSGPNGVGFFSCAVGGSNAIQVYCGAFESTMNSGVVGRWNVVISGSQLSGIGAVTGGGLYEFTGTVTGTGTTRTVAVNQDLGSGVTLTADGTLDTSTDQIGGTYALDDNGTPSDAGNWTGGDCSSGGGSQSTQLSGTFINATEGGFMDLTIQSAVLAPARPAPSMGQHAVQATGTLHLEGGGTIPLAGYYNPETDTLVVTGTAVGASGVRPAAGGGLPTYSFIGVYDASGINGIVGQYLGPYGPGFFGCAVGGTNDVKVYCGQFQNEAMDASGRWNLIVVGTNVVGIAISTENDEFPFEGTVSGTGTSLTINLAADDGAGGTLSATGTLDTTTNTISNGSWTTYLNDTPVDNGTWDGALCTGQSGATY